MHPRTKSRLTRKEWTARHNELVVFCSCTSLWRKPLCCRQPQLIDKSITVWTHGKSILYHDSRRPWLGMAKPTWHGRSTQLSVCGGSEKKKVATSATVSATKETTDRRKIGGRFPPVAVQARPVSGQCPFPLLLSILP